MYWSTIRFIELIECMLKLKHYTEEDLEKSPYQATDRSFRKSMQKSSKCDCYSKIETLIRGEKWVTNRKNEKTDMKGCKILRRKRKGVGVGWRSEKVRVLNYSITIFRRFQSWKFLIMTWVLFFLSGLNPYLACFIIWRGLTYDRLKQLIWLAELVFLFYYFSFILIFLIHFSFSLLNTASRCLFFCFLCQ